MANDISDITLGMQQEWFNQALAQQKAVYEATLKMWSRFFAVPRVIERARDVSCFRRYSENPSKNALSPHTCERTEPTDFMLENRFLFLT